MPTAFGNPAGEQESGALTLLRPTGDPREIERLHRQREQERMAVPDEMDAVVELSERTQVYIYSVGAWAQQLALGSLGSRFIACLPEERVLVAGDLSVSTPLMIAGVPSETYPDGDGGKRIYHAPKKHDPLRKHTGLHLALEAIGAAPKSSKDNDLRPYGVFVSTQIEQPKPKPGATAAEIKAFAQWEADVRKAQGALRKKFSHMCAFATAQWKKGKFQDSCASDDNYFLVARILKKTKIDCPWLENTEAANENKSCIECEEPIPSTALRCSKCGAKQVSDEKYAAESARRRGEVVDDAPAGKKKVQ